MTGSIAANSTVSVPIVRNIVFFPFLAIGFIRVFLVVFFCIRKSFLMIGFIVFLLFGKFFLAIGFVVYFAARGRSGSALGAID